MSEKKYIPINKGHCELDTPQRSREFSQKLGRGWENEYQEYRRQWVELPRTRTLREYPLLVDLELSSLCNLHCPMCPTSRPDYRKSINAGLMATDLARKIIQEVAGKVFALRLSLVGEPTLHRDLVDIVRFAKERGIREVSFLTNGSTLSPPYFQRLLEAGIDWITISVDGLKDEYERIRKPLKFQDMVDKLSQIKQLKTERGVEKPVIKIQGIWPAIRPDPTRYYETFLPITDLIAYNPLIDYLRKDSEEEIEYVPNFSCPQPYQRLVICSDGMAKMCSNDEERSVIVGNTTSETIWEIWHGRPLESVRNKHLEPSGFMQIHACKHCYYPRKTEDSEKARVGERVISIENYTHRKQIIGE